MTDLQRRKFIKIAGGAAAAAAVVGLPPSLVRALSIKGNSATGSINDIEHVVILMQENRSFDHYLGALRGVRGFGDRFPIPLEGGGRVWDQSNGTRVVKPFHLDKNTMNAALIKDMPHFFYDAQAAWNQGKYGHWPQYKTDGSMGYYTRSEAPFQYALADAFTICDAYHCSVQGCTDPNRIMFWSGSNHDPRLRDAGINCDDTTAEPTNIRCNVVGQMPSPGYAYTGSAFTWDTIPDVLERNNISWKIYQDPNNNWWGLMHGGLAFDSFRSALPGSAHYDKGMSHHSIDDLASDVMAGTLPAVTWILPTPMESEHPFAPSSAGRGGHFVERILQALTGNPDSWSKTAFFITYDENDGLFDHVPPPAVPSYDAEGNLAGKSSVPVEGMYFAVNKPEYVHPSDTITGDLRVWGMGPRVPMFVISPWSKGGWVNSQVFDHTSMGMFLEKRFGITIPAISRWHRTVSGDLTSAFDFSSPNSPSLPALPSMANYEAVEAASARLPVARPPAVEQPMVREPGVRYSRPLPYDLAVYATPRPDGRLRLDFVNNGAQGAVLHVYDKKHLANIPRRYTVAARARLDDDIWRPSAVDGGHYDLEVFGPNGFFRSFQGDVFNEHDAGVEMAMAYRKDARELVLTLTNKRARAVNLDLRFNAYRKFDSGATLSLPAGAATERAWKIDSVGNWYDFSVTGEALAYRFAGRMESGMPSISDPAQ
ncbi:phospholipase C, phosphocholine-specific [Luteibacter sp. dw_328]|uniref:phosphocholine-specific phospholipase C n=1 Tax=Luteibacter sp. dw_328 TaxID=2719796 RepID=UPI001BD5966C|nr:phospholipase C, phosphocholine-specific [Luteibacter sp. dw_328]